MDREEDCDFSDGVFGRGRGQHLVCREGDTRKDCGHRLALFGWSGGRSGEKQGSQHQAVPIDHQVKATEADVDYWLLDRIPCPSFTMLTTPFWALSQNMPSRRKGDHYARRYKKRKLNILNWEPAQGSSNVDPQQPSQYSSSTST
jgi:hypothetical protein